MKWATNRFRFVFLAGAVAIASTVFSQPSPPPRLLTVDVTIRDAGGTPVDGIPIAWECESFPQKRTSADGTVRLQAMVSADTAFVWLTLYPNIGELYDERDTDIARFWAVTRAGAYEHVYKIPITPEQSSCTASIVAAEGVTVTGRFVLPQGVPARKHVSVLQSNCIVGLDIGEDGRFTSAAIRRGQATELYAYLYKDTRVLVLPISASQSVSEVDLGDIAIPARPAGRQVDVTMINLEGVKGDNQYNYARNRHLVFVSSDGASVHYMDLRKNGKAFVRGSRAPDEPKLPPGTYFACPGSLDGNGEPKRLLDLLRAGRAGDVEAAMNAAGIQRLVVPNDGGTAPIPYSFDAVQAESAIRSIQ